MSESFHALNDAALDTLFRSARSQNKWHAETISPTLLMALYDLVRLGPTAANSTPARIHFVVSPEAKARLVPLVTEGNRAKVQTAPVIAIIGYDLGFPDLLPTLFPHNPKVKDAFAGKPELTEKVALRNSSMQGGYFIVAARALGLDCGPMSGFDNDAVDKEFFAGTQIKSNFLCALGHGDSTGIFGRNPRLSFDEACKIL